MSHLLTIVIPTYNRLEHLKKNILPLLSQLTSECKLVIIDNHSEINIEDNLKDILKGRLNCEVDFVRNPINIGLFGNILKCFELCTSKWLYILGDDDSISADGISRILSDIKKHFDYINISYKWKPEKKWSIMRPKTTNSFVDYANSIEGIHHVMFLSSNIYNVDKMNKNIFLGHYFQLTSAPHLVMLFLALDRNPESKVLLSDNCIVNNLNSEVEEEKKWDKLDFFRNIKLLLDLPMTNENKEALFYLYKKSYPLKKYFRNYTILGLRGNNKININKEFKKATIYFRVYGSYLDRFLILIFSILLFFPKQIKQINSIFKD